jgi:hypothetical protein
MERQPLVTMPPASGIACQRTRYGREKKHFSFAFPFSLSVYNIYILILSSFEAVLHSMSEIGCIKHDIGRLW